MSTAGTPRAPRAAVSAISATMAVVTLLLLGAPPPVDAAGSAGEGPGSAALVVDSAGDAGRGHGVEGACDTGRKAGGLPRCTLRAAIETANRRAGPSRITFAIGGDSMPVLNPATSYPVARRSIRIDGTSQAGGWVQIRGSSDRFPGLRLDGSGSHVTGLVISGFSSGIVVRGDGIRIEGVRIGTDGSGDGAHLGTTGIRLSGATDTVISDSVLAGRDAAISATSGATATVTGNRIGSGPTGTSFGVDTGIHIGPSEGGGAWTISGNTITAARFGILTRGPAAAASTILGNTIALPAPASGPPPVGILIDGTPSVTIGGNASIVASGGQDIIVTGAAQTVDDATGVTIASPEAAVAGAVTGGDVIIGGNTLGLDASGAVAADRSRSGIVVYGAASRVRIEGNLIAGHQETEVELYGGSGHRVMGNSIGVDRTGSVALGGPNGVFLNGVSDALVQDNLISGITHTGLSIDADPTQPGEPRSRAVTVTGNRIGTTADTLVALPNGLGVFVGDADEVTIGPGNVISGNTVGIWGDRTTTGLAIEGDTIGADRTRGVAVPNGIGIELEAPEVAITGTWILGNTGAGIQVEGGTVAVADSIIGVGATGEALGNGVGISVLGGASATLSDTTVANSRAEGISIDGRARVWMLRGSTFGNAGQGIGGPGALPAPRLDGVAVGSGGGARRWFIVSGVERDGQVRLYGNTSCDDPDEGMVSVEVTVHGSSATSGGWHVVSTTDGRTFAGYTAIGLDDDARNVSAFSNCAGPVR